MVLSIDKKKIKAQLAKNRPAYEVTPYNLEVVTVHRPPPSAEVHSMVTEVSPELERARERLLALRQRIIDEGRSPLSPEELEEQIGQARGRT